MKRVVGFAVGLALLASGPTIAQRSQLLADQPINFARDIQPVLQAHCAQCHGGDERNGGINFADRASLLAEADSGSRAVVPSKPEQSQLLQRIESTDENDRMPPEGPRLSEQQIQRITHWIASGAPWTEDVPDGQPAAATREHWAFKPLQKVHLPETREAAWGASPIDRLVQAQRESAGLPLVGDADPAMLIRRATYDLTGLPPTPAEVRAFVEAVQAPVGIEIAFARLIDRLLSQPEYGQRWGRHWMDWVRYADTAGDNSDYPIPQAYLYRNYIIDSFNDDLPYDQFVREQIAGDLLPAESPQERNRQRIATGYLAMARRFGSLVERYPWHLTIEDTIDNLGRTMLGLTISCARCHDHKFDPISTRDYYGIYGIFASTRYPFPGIELFQTQRDFVPLVPDAAVQAVMEPFQETTDRLEAELDSLLAQCEEQAIINAAQASHVSLDERRKMQEKLDAMMLKARKAGERLAQHLKTIPAMPTAYAVRDAQPINARIQIKGDPDRPGAEAPRKFLDVLGGHRLPDDVTPSQSGRLQLAQWIACTDNPLTARVIVNRVWQRHFGQGLVSTPSDFGVRGAPPSHPDLLDYLAAEFIDSGWSIKHLHRMIMNSRTYRLSSADRQANLAVDPDNRLYWKFNRQRLDAESIRDTLLLVAGTLDNTVQTEPHPFPPPEQWKFTQHHPFKDDYPTHRRSVYRMTKRLTADTYYQTFDGPDPNVCTSDRDQSVTALQALYFVNAAFLHEQAAHFAQRLLQLSDDDDQRLILAVETLLCRCPDPDELTMLRRHLELVRDRLAAAKDCELQAWSSVARSLMRLNEFLYID